MGLYWQRDAAMKPSDSGMSKTLKRKHLMFSLLIYEETQFGDIEPRRWEYFTPKRHPFIGSISQDATFFTL